MNRFTALVAVALLGTSAAQAEDLKTAVVAGGCFWCVESDFDKVPGVVDTVSGYTGGTTDNPTYKQVTYGSTGHYEAVQITYDADKISFQDVLTTFWRTVDPTDAGGQFCDRGASYRTAVFVASAEERSVAEATKAEAAAQLGQEIVTPVVDAGPFWPAEEYHQNYYKKSPVKYNYYRWRCGRDARIEDLWGDDAHKGVKKADS